MRKIISELSLIPSLIWSSGIDGSIAIYMLFHSTSDWMSSDMVMVVVVFSVLYKTFYSDIVTYCALVCFVKLELKLNVWTKGATE